MLQKTPASKDSKSVCEQSHEGSNPSRCAKNSLKPPGFKEFFMIFEGKMTIT